MTDSDPGQLHYARYQDFLDADPRRRGDALELGHQWRDGDDRYRVCWYAETGELPAERLDPRAGLEPENFERGVAGPVEVIHSIGDHALLDSLLGTWPNIAPGEPRTLSRLRELLLSAGSVATATPLRPQR